MIVLMFQMQRVLALVLAVAALAAGGCTGPVPGSVLDEGLGFADVRFHDEGSPLDVSAEPVTNLSLAAAVRAAMQASPEIQAAAARVRVALADAKQSRLLPNPVLSVALRYPEGGGKPVIEAGLGADLLSILQRAGRSSAADHRLRAASADAVSTALDVLAEVQQIYAAVQSLEAQAAVLEERRKLIDRLLHLAERRLDKGEGTRLDVTTLQTQQIEVETEIAEQQLEQREQRLALARWIGAPSSTADWKLDAWQPPGPLAPGEDQWIAAALRHRSDVQSRHWDLAALGDEQSLARWGALDGAEIGLDAERDGSWELGPALASPIPVFDTGQARRSRASAEVIEARHQLTLARRKAVEETRRAHASYTITAATLSRVRDQLVPLQEKRRQQAEAAYLAGQTDVTGLLLAEQDLQASREKLLSLQRRTTEAHIRLERAVGGPIIADGLAPVTQPSR